VPEPEELIPVGIGEYAGEARQSWFPWLLRQMSHSLRIVWGGGQVAIDALSRDHLLDPEPSCRTRPALHRTGAGSGAAPPRRRVTTVPGDAGGPHDGDVSQRHPDTAPGSEDPMTTQTFHTGNDPDTIAVQGPEPTELTSPSSLPSRRRVRRAVAVVAASAVALTAFGVTWQIRADDDPPAVVPQRATEADLRLAAEWARRMEILAPELDPTSPRSASYTDLRLAAEWARRLESLGTAPAQETSGGH
jgi:hypothetical protein